MIAGGRRSRLTGITYPDHSTVSFTYDSRGRRITSTDQNGKTITYTYHDADRLTAVTDPASNTTQYAYDTENNLLSITDANAHATQFAYNSRGWVTQTTFHRRWRSTTPTTWSATCSRRPTAKATRSSISEPVLSVAEGTRCTGWRRIPIPTRRT